MIYNYEPIQADELRLITGDILTFSGTFDEGWMKGEINGITGMFPSNYVELVPMESWDPLVGNSMLLNAEASGKFIFRISLVLLQRTHATNHKLF